MGKILVLMLLTTAAVALPKRDVRSPTPSLGWQLGNSYSYDGLPFINIARSTSSNWGRAGRVRSSRNGGWSSNTVGSRYQNTGYGSKRSSHNGWPQNGYGSNSAFGGTLVRSYYPELRGRSSDSTVIDSIDSLAWDGSGFYSNNGWDYTRSRLQ